MKRRDFVTLGGMAVAGAALRLSPGQMTMPPQGSQEAGAADVTLRIAPVAVELAPDRILSTIGYNGTSPGPLLRMREGKPISVDVINETDTPELVHWHGMHLDKLCKIYLEERYELEAPYTIYVQSSASRYQFVDVQLAAKSYLRQDLLTALLEPLS